MVYVPNPRFDEQLREEGDLTEGLLEAAEEARKKAEPLAPRILPRDDQAFSVDESEGEVSLANNDFGGHLAEWGSVNNPPSAPLRRGVRAAGLRLDETPK